MRKLGIIVAITILCAFSVVRRRDDKEGEPFFNEVISQVTEKTDLIYKVEDRETAVTNKGYLFQDVPTEATFILSSGFFHAVLVTYNQKLSWIETKALRNEPFKEADACFWDLN